VLEMAGVRRIRRFTLSAEGVKPKGKTTTERGAAAPVRNGSFCREDLMRRRDFCSALGVTIIALPCPAHAGQTGKPPRVGMLWHAANEIEEAPYLGAFRRGMKNLGYIEGQNVELVLRFADEKYERFDAQAAELVQLKVDLIYAVTPPAALAAKRATTTIPVVFLSIPDPVRLKLVEKISRPGGNMTGFSHMMHELQGKRLEMLKRAAPSVSNLALLVNPGNGDIHRKYVEETQAAQASLNITSRPIELSKPDEIEDAFATIDQGKFDGVMLYSDGLFFAQRERIARLLLERRLPSMWFSRETAEPFGALMSYGPELQSIFYRSATYVDKILKGTNPADLPVEFPTKYPIVFNLKTADAIGVEVPQSFLALVDDVIE
jgi:putative ABC transport system substrate-binding protein